MEEPGIAPKVMVGPTIEEDNVAFPGGHHSCLDETVGLDFNDAGDVDVTAGGLGVGLRLVDSRHIEMALIFEVVTLTPVIIV